ncbi:MAG: hypothetical protein P9M15_07850 [Candidatus Electryoneaceae bacterium]|nr:hypothetical protein [Candidatus Electryoneaceae bacterium]
MKRSKTISVLSAVLLVTFLLVACQEKTEVVTEEVTSQTEESDSIEQSQIRDAKNILPVIFNAVKFYRNDHTCNPISVEELEQGNYLLIDSLSKQNWEFSLVFNNDSLISITARTEYRNRPGSGILTYNVKTKKFTSVALY